MSLLAFCRAGPSNCRRIYSNDLLKGRNYATEVISAFTKPSAFGQPLYPSHPHLRMFFFAYVLLAALILNVHIVQRDEVTPGIALNEYKKRRSRLMQALPDSSMVVSVAAPVKYMSGGM